MTANKDTLLVKMDVELARRLRNILYHEWQTAGNIHSTEETMKDGADELDGALNKHTDFTHTVVDVEYHIGRDTVTIPYLVCAEQNPMDIVDQYFTERYGDKDSTANVTYGSNTYGIKIVDKTTISNQKADLLDSHLPVISA
jgi:hypothetical protein